MYLTFAYLYMYIYICINLWIHRSVYPPVPARWRLVVSSSVASWEIPHFVRWIPVEQGQPWDDLVLVEHGTKLTNWAFWTWAGHEDSQIEKPEVVAFGQLGIGPKIQEVSLSHLLQRHLWTFGSRVKRPFWQRCRLVRPLETSRCGGWLRVF